MSLSVDSIMNGQSTVTREHAFHEMSKHYKRNVRRLTPNSPTSPDPSFFTYHVGRAWLIFTALFLGVIGIFTASITGLDGNLTPYAASLLVIAVGSAGGAVFIHRKLKAYNEQPLNRVEVEVLLSEVAKKVTAVQTLYGLS